MASVALDEALKAAELALKVYSGAAQPGPAVAQRASDVLAKSLEIIAGHIGVEVKQ